MKTFTKEELRDVVISIVVLSLVFWVYRFSFPDIQGFFLSLLVVFFSFFLHEMGHKFAARRLRCMATYRIWSTGLLIGIISIFFGIIGFGIAIIAVGFVEIMPYSFGRWGFKVVRLTPKDYGLISLAGVGLNVLFGVLFKIFPGGVFATLSYFNGLFAFFNLLPFPPLDGSKIFMWKKWFWLFLLFVSVLSVLSSVGFI